MSTTMPEVLEQIQEGILEMHPKGFGFLRQPGRRLEGSTGDVYVPAPLIIKYGLREGMWVAGKLMEGNGVGPRLATVEAIEGQPPELLRRRDFDKLTPIDPNFWLRLETGPQPLTTRVIDLLCPIGKGQRGLIVAPPRSGKTILLQHIAQAVAKNYPDVKVMVLLVDERPEEVTEMKRSIPGDVFASSNDNRSAEHIRLAEMVFERAKRLAEMGYDVFLLLDSLTRLSRAYNKQIDSGGKIMSGGLDVRALEVPRRLFGTARAFEEGGSLTVIATCLVETGSRMDDIIFEEFKGTGNLEIVLDRKLAERRVFPAISIPQSGTRKEERLFPPQMYQQIVLLRRALSAMKPVEAMEMLVQMLPKYQSNAEFLARVGEFAALSGE
ncbi:MAG: transcription termination factor Rho [Gemmatales bacterium]|nr:transcription termination factor Rho [Gemmatales bacterium]MDW8175718.1 transcription termination factor Rho [Gemmatales bacterium]MDW8222453.1 transcription termination factor Rho [Gemmatales bacterium]